MGVMIAFAVRDWQVARTYRVAVVIQALGAALSLATFYYLGRAVDGPDTSSAFPEGYFAFASIGIAMLFILSAAILGPASKMREGQVSGTLEALIATPVPPALIAIAGSAYDLLRSVAMTLISVVLAVLIFGLDLRVDVGGLAGAAAGIVGGTLVGLAGGLLIAAVGMIVRRGESIGVFATTIVSLASGVYFPADVLPAGAQAVAEALPTTWAISLVRSGLVDGTVDWVLAAGLLFAGVLALVAASLAFERATDRARRLGTLLRV